MKIMREKILRMLMISKEICFVKIKSWADAQEVL
jgi:hypothetical protein